MGKYLKKFDTHSEYEAFTQTEDFILPNVSYCVDNNEVHYNPWTDPRLIVRYNVEDASNPTQLYTYVSQEGMTIDGATMFDKIEIDGTEVSISDLDSASGQYQLSEGEYTVRYTLKDPTFIGLEMDEQTQMLTKIGACFTGPTAIVSVEIPDSVTEIGYGAFYGCSSLTSVTIPNSVTSIGQNAFYGCSGLTSITIPNSVTTIGHMAFVGCIGLISVTIGNSVTSIGQNAFYGCSNLTSVVSLATTAPTINSETFWGINTNGTLTVPSGSSGYDVWMQKLGSGWTKVEQ